MPVNDFLGKPDLQYIGVFFTALYCPPCQAIQEPLKAFYEEYKKSGKFEMVMIGCDKREREFSEHLKELQWVHAMPHDAADELVAAIEDAANAETIPRLSIFSVARGFEKPVVADAKGPIMRTSSAEEAISQIEKKILDGEDQFNAE